MRDYLSIHNHTQYSNIKIIDSINRSENMVDYAWDLNMKGLVFTDHDCLSGTLNELDVFRAKLQKEWSSIHPDEEYIGHEAASKELDFKVILGNEIYLSEEGLTEAQMDGTHPAHFWHLILIAKDAEGFHQLKQLSSAAWKRAWFRGILRTPTYPSDLFEFVKGEHLICSTACFRQGTQVLTKNGYKRIEDITSSDFIYNRYGQWEKVNFPTSRLYEGRGFKITTTGDTEPIICTENHKFLTVSTRHNKQIEWVEAKDLSINKENKHILLHPYNTTYTNNSIIYKKDFIKEHKFIKYTLPDEIVITPELMRLFGLFLGDGSIVEGKNPRINFTFNDKEFPIYWDSFFKNSENILNIKWSVFHRDSQNRYDVNSASVELYDLFEYLFGLVDAKTKTIPSKLLHINKELDMELWFGYMLADGYFRTKITDGYMGGEFTSASISEKLTRQMSDLVNGFGITNSVYLEKEHFGSGCNHQNAWYMTGSNKFLGQINKLHPYTHSELIDIMNKAIEYKKKDYFEQDGILYHRIRLKNIEQIEMNETVYCLNVDSHSFLCKNVIVHNCLGGYPAWCWKNYCLALEDDGFISKADGQEEPQFYLNKLDNHLAAMEELFGKGNFYIELQPNEKGSEQNEYNKFMINRYWGLYPFVFSTDSHYLKADEREIHKAFLNSKSSKDREVDEFYKCAYMMDYNEIKNLLSDCVTIEQIEEMKFNTQKIASKCEFYELEQKPKLATVEYKKWEEYDDDIQIFDEVDKETYPNFYYYIHSEKESDSYLAHLVAHGYVNKYKEDWNEKVYFSRLEEEFWTLKEVGEKIEQSMADYFITMSKIIDICWEDAQTIVGPSRGSAGALLINYLLGITQMNPIKMELPFVWRFLHPSRPDLPDIDFDTESDKRAKVFLEVKKYFESLGGDVINVCTFGTEGTKSALRTAGRGLNIDEDTIVYLTSMIPNERGFDWSLSECYYGNGDDRQPIKAFKDEMDKNPRLWTLAQNIEGLITRLGVHASGVVCVNDDFTNYNSYMKTSKEQIVTSYDLHTLERVGMVKYDFLTVSALDRIRQCMNYMLEDGTIEWQGSLRQTYNKYLHPEVLDYDSPQMWDMVGKGEINSLFQFDTLVGSQAIKDIQPRSVNELAISSSLMRLMSDGELPLAKYARFKRVPQFWYDEMHLAKLNADEVKILEKYLLKKKGVGESQEVIMQIVMDPHISGFDMKEANKLRKTIAKKKFREIEQVRELFYEKGKAIGTRKELLDYVWNVQVSMQLG